MNASNRLHRLTLSTLCIALIVATLHSRAAAQSEEELAKKLSNPVAAMISVPFQFNYDEKIGPAHGGHHYVMNIQPVVPISLGPDWNLISRTILPVTNQFDIVPGSGRQFGLGDITQSLFFSPKAVGLNGIIWGAGPAFLIPTATNGLLGGEKWGAGPTAVVLKQSGAWTYGILANHIWSYAGDRTRNDISSTFLQPFLAHTTKGAWTYTVNLESTYDWLGKQWSIPINVQITKLLKFGNQPVSIGGGVRYWAASTDSGPHGWGGRFIVTFLFPTK